MKNNKGYTLVELLISLALLAIIMLEIFGVMQNSSKLYSNGTYEVELQTEAQQVIQQLNELMIDANHSISANYNPTTSSNDITISNNDAIYTIALSKADPADEYGMLYYTKQDLSGGTSTPGPIPMAEYVNSISLNMLEYERNNFVTLSVSMNNGKYSYVANQAIYLRNEIGSGQNTSYSAAGAFDYDLDILRLRTYDLDSVVAKDGVTFTYAWDSASAAEASSKFTFSGDRNHKIETSNTTNMSTDFVGYYTVIATGSDGTIVKIRISAQKVDFGNGHKGLMFANTDSGYRYISAIPISGIAIEEASSITAKLNYYTNPTSGLQESVQLYGSESDLTVRYNYNDGTGNFAEMSLSKVAFGHNDAVNTFEVYCWYFQYNQGQQYKGYLLQTGSPLTFDIKIEFSGAPDLTGTVYVYPYALDSSAMPADAEQIFWNAVGW
ncbi:MAG: prepilin-type N-terminal cleavage/methylation domain-containing protein [Lachnospiraceae bacterium]|nr:prepilin-type N-terminal cleavage/methylation domain-containing protein [Lachnospiraceae bacterium]